MKGDLTPKEISKKIKSSGLQKLKWYCQMCQKQCRDENGFQNHCKSENHIRQMKLFSEDKNEFIGSYSKLFEQGYMETLKQRHGTCRVKANSVYQQYIADRNHVHMNATSWITLGTFVQYLGKTGQCVVEKTPKGWFITLIDRDPAKAQREAEKRRRESSDLDASERLQKQMEEQLAYIRTHIQIEDHQATELRRCGNNDNGEEELVTFGFKSSAAPQITYDAADFIDDDDDDEDANSIKKSKTIIKEFQLKQQISSSSNNNPIVKSEIGFSSSVDGNDDNQEDDEQENGAATATTTNTSTRRAEEEEKCVQPNTTPSSSSSSSTKLQIKKRINFQQMVSSSIAPQRNAAAADSSEDTKNFKLAPTTTTSSTNEGLLLKKRKVDVNSSLDAIMHDHMAAKERKGRRDYWLHPGIIVKVMNKTLAGGKYYKMKGKVLEVIDNYAGKIQMVDGGAVLKLDQEELETVLPALGGQVTIVNGAYRGESAVLRAIHEDTFSADIYIPQGPQRGRVVANIAYEDFCKSSEIVV